MLQPRVSVKDRVKSINDRAAEAEASSTLPGSRPLGQSQVSRRTTVAYPAVRNEQPPALSQAQKTVPTQRIPQPEGGDPRGNDTNPYSAKHDIPNSRQFWSQTTDEGLDEAQTRMTQVVTLGSTSTAPQDATSNAPDNTVTITSVDKTPQASDPPSSTSPLAMTPAGSATFTDPAISSNGSFGRRQSARFGHPATHYIKLPEDRKSRFQEGQISYERGIHLPHREHEPNAPDWSGKPCPHHDHSTLQGSDASSGPAAADDPSLLLSNNAQAQPALQDVSSLMPETNQRSPDPSVTLTTDVPSRTISASRIQVTIVEKASSVDSDESEDPAGVHEDRSSRIEINDTLTRIEPEICGPLVQGTPQQIRLDPPSDTLRLEPAHPTVSGRSSPWLRLNASGERVFTPMTGRRSTSRSSYTSDSDVLNKAAGSNVAISVMSREEIQKVQPPAGLKSRETSTPAPESKAILEDRDQQSKPSDDRPCSLASSPVQSITLSADDFKVGSLHVDEANSAKAKSDSASGANLAQSANRGNDEAFVVRIEQRTSDPTQVSNSSGSVLSRECHELQLQTPQDGTKHIEAIASPPSQSRGNSQETPASEVASYPSRLSNQVVQLDVPQVDNVSNRPPPVMTNTPEAVQRASPVSREDRESSLAWIRHPVPEWEFGDVSGAPAFSASGLPQSLAPNYEEAALQRRPTSHNLGRATPSDEHSALDLAETLDDAPKATSLAVRYEECSPIKADRKHRTNSMVITGGEVSETEIAISPRDKNVFQRGSSSPNDEPATSSADRDRPVDMTRVSSIEVKSMASERQAVPEPLQGGVLMRVRLKDIDVASQTNTTTDLTPTLISAQTVFASELSHASSNQAESKLKVSITDAISSPNDASSNAGDGRADRQTSVAAVPSVANTTQPVKLSTALDFFMPSSRGNEPQESDLNAAFSNTATVSSNPSTQPSQLEAPTDMTSSLSLDNPIHRPVQEVSNSDPSASVSSGPAIAAESRISPISIDVVAEPNVVRGEFGETAGPLAPEHGSLDLKPTNPYAPSESINDIPLNGVVRTGRRTRDEPDLAPVGDLESDLEERRRMLLDAAHDLREACKERYAAIQVVLHDLLHGLKDYKEQHDPNTQRIDDLIELIERHAREDWSFDLGPKLAVLSQAADGEQQTRAKSVSPPPPQRPGPLAVSPSVSPKASRRSSNLETAGTKPWSTADAADGIRLLQPGVREQWFRNCDVIIRPWPVARRQVSEDGSSGSETVHEIIRSYVR